MEPTMNDTLEYVLSLTPHIRDEDVPSAILILLLELGFQSGSDGFWYLRKAILIRCYNPDMRVSSIYHEIALESRYMAKYNHVDQAILGTIKTAWKNRDPEKWGYFFSEKKIGKAKKPSNKEFIAELGSVMELWRDCSKEGCYGTK